MKPLFYYLDGKSRTIKNLKELQEFLRKLENKNKDYVEKYKLKLHNRFYIPDANGTKFGYTLLGQAVKNGDLETVKYLIKLGYPYSAIESDCNYSNPSLMLAAIQSGNLGILKLLVDTYPDFKNDLIQNKEIFSSLLEQCPDSVLDEFCDFFNDLKIQVGLRKKAQATTPSYFADFINRKDISHETRLRIIKKILPKVLEEQAKLIKNNVKPENWISKYDLSTIAKKGDIETLKFIFNEIKKDPVLQKEYLKITMEALSQLIIVDTYNFHEGYGVGVTIEGIKLGIEIFLKAQPWDLMRAVELNQEFLRCFSYSLIISNFSENTTMFDVVHKFIKESWNFEGQKEVLLLLDKLANADLKKQLMLLDKYNSKQIVSTANNSIDKDLFGNCLFDFNVLGIVADMVYVPADSAKQKEMHEACVTHKSTNADEIMLSPAITPLKDCHIKIEQERKEVVEKMIKPSKGL